MPPYMRCKWKEGKRTRKDLLSSKFRWKGQTFVPWLKRNLTKVATADNFNANKNLLFSILFYFFCGTERWQRQTRRRPTYFSMQRSFLPTISNRRATPPSLSDRPFSTPLMQIDADTSRYRCQIRSGSSSCRSDILSSYRPVGLLVYGKLLAIHADICGFAAAESNCILVIEQVNA